MSWIRGKVPPPARLPKGIATRFGRVSASPVDQELVRHYNAKEGFDRGVLRKQTLRYGKWHNPRKRTEPPSNMEDGWLVAEDYPPRVYVPPPAEQPPEEPPEKPPWNPNDPVEP